MRLSELKELFDHISDSLGDEDPDLEIVMGYQPNYPLEAGIAGLALDGDKIIVLAGSHNGYGRKAWWGGGGSMGGITVLEETEEED
jgi:hypothetical protein